VRLYVLLVAVASELLVLSLDLVKNRVVVMGADMRKNFIGTVLVGLIEKSPDIKIMKAITKVCVCIRPPPVDACKAITKVPVFWTLAIRLHLNATAIEQPWSRLTSKLHSQKISHKARLLLVTYRFIIKK
jgi:hypothetical protein